MAMPEKPTMSEMEIRCSRLLGYGAMNGALKRIQPIVREHLMLAQEMLIEEFRDELTRKINDDEPGPTNPAQTLYDVPDDCDPQEIKRFRVKFDERDYRNLAQGIDTRHRSYMTPEGWPRRYDVRLGTSGQAQIEIWPIPDAVYPLQLEYWIRATRFTQDNDRVSLDPTLVFLYAIANLKNHYQQKDAEAYSRQLEMRLTSIKSKQHGNRHYKRSFRNDRYDSWSNARYDESSGTGTVQLNDFYW